MKFKWKKVLVMAMTATLLSANLCALAENVESRKLSILQVSGEEGYVMKQVPRRLKAIAGMNLGEGNQVSTGKSSYIYIEADEDKTLKLDANTVVDVEKASSKSLKLELLNGKLFFNVENPLDEDEEMRFEAAHTSMSIRGTSGMFVYNPAALTFYLIEGNVVWDLGNGQILEVKAGQKVDLIRDWGEDAPGPGSDAGYVLQQIGTFHWTDLSMEQLKTVLENREKLDLSAIGLDTTEEQEKAQNVVHEYEEQKKAEELAKKKTYTSVDRDDDDDREEHGSSVDKENPGEELIPDEDKENPGEELIPDGDKENSGEELPPDEEKENPGEELNPDGNKEDAAIS